jgi:hypothetical protein
MALLMCLFVADRKGLFDGFWLNRIVGIGGTLGSLAAIAVGGLHLGDGYGRLAANLLAAVTRSALCAVLILLLSTGLNRVGFRLKL